jgi:dUTP pyrophosphatase
LCYLLGDDAANLVGIASPMQVQPAGVDLRVWKIWRFLGPGVLYLDSKKLQDVEEVEAVGGYWDLAPGAYKVTFADPVQVPLWAVGFCYPRSSLLRMGVTLNCAVWDPGYKGRGEALLIVHNPHGVKIEYGARIAQMVFARLEEPVGRGYEGSYQGENL